MTRRQPVGESSPEWLVRGVNARGFGAAADFRSSVALPKPLGKGPTGTGDAVSPAAGFMPDRDVARVSAGGSP